LPLVIRPTTHVAQGWHKHPFQLEMYRVADRLIVSTEFERRVLVEQGVEEEKTVLIGNGMHAGPFLEADGAGFRRRYGIGDAKVVAFVGRKTAGKGAEHVIDAMELVWQQMPSACLVMAGQHDSTYANTIKERLQRVGEPHAGAVVDIADFAEAEKAEIYGACDVFVMPSNTDSFGIVYLEAWASGKPVIACKGTPQETIIDQEKDGLLVGYGETGELADAILRLLSDDGLRVRLGEKGREKVLANYTWEIVAGRVRDVYRELVEAGC
jgi:glycosyltransferase involved in cell wall biosynthesis